MAGHGGGGVVRAPMLLLLLLACLVGAASGLEFFHDHYASMHSSTPRWYRYDPEAAIAIDLGNTNSCIAGYTREGPGAGETETMFRLCIPSWVAFPDDGSRVLVGEAAKNHADTHPEAATAISGFKRMLGLRYEDDTVQRLIQHVPYKIGPSRRGMGVAIQLNAGKEEKELYEIAAMVVDHLRKMAEDHLGVSRVRDAVIVVPEHSNDASRQEGWNAGKLAGLDVVGTVTGPVAAAAAYGLGDKLKLPEDGSDGNALVLHVGGGTASATVLTLTAGGGSSDVLGHANDPFLGGDDFDRRVVDYFVNVIKMKHGEDVSQDRAALSRLGVAAEHAKKVLSSQEHAQVSVESLLGGGGMDFEESLSRRTFEKLSGDLFWKVMALVDSAMEEAELERSEIDEIILVGGSTMIPKIQRLVKDYFYGKEPNIRVKPDEAVALGAAVEIHSLKYRRFENLDLI